MEDGWKGEEGESEKVEEEVGGENGETRQSHEEHMRTLAGMALSHPSTGSSIRPEPRVVSCSHLSSPFQSLCSHFVFYLCSHSEKKTSRIVIFCIFPVMELSAVGLVQGGGSGQVRHYSFFLNCKIIFGYKDVFKTFTTLNDKTKQPCAAGCEYG